MIKIDMLALKEPKHVIFEHGVFNHIRPVRVGDLKGQKFKKIMVGALYAKNFEAHKPRTQKNQNFNGLSLKFAILYFLAY
jgi:hypothetical protein